MPLALKKKPDQEGTSKKAAAPRKARKVSVPIQKGGKARRFVLLIGDEGAILVYMEGSKVVRRLFAPSAQPANTEAMVALMQSNPSVPLSLLIDNLDQQFVRQSFPPVSSLSVSGLVKRRLDRDFQPEDLKGSLPLGRDKTGRKEWHFLLISLAKTANFTEWLDLVSELPNELKGIYLAPVEATIYVKMLTAALAIPAPKPWQLIVTHNKVSGFRQVVVNQDKLVFTRISQAIDDAIPAVIAGNIEQEIINTIEYLRRLGFQDGNGLDIIVVASADVNEVIDLGRFNLGFAKAVTPLDVAEAFGLEQAALSADRFGDVVMAASFLRAKKRVLRFSTAYADSLAKLYTVRKAIKGIAALLILAMLGLSVQNLMESSKNKQLASESERNRSGLQGQLAELKKNVAGLNDNLAFKSVVANAYDTYLQDAYHPTDFVRTLAANVTPEQRIISMEWIDNSKKAPAAANAGGTPTAPGEDAPLTVKVLFEFKGVYADVDELAKAEQAFIDNLTAQMPDYTITHELFPWLKGAEKSLEISFDQQQSAGIKEGDNRLTVTFAGPKKQADAAAAGSPQGMPAMGGMPAGAMP